MEWKGEKIKIKMKYNKMYYRTQDLKNTSFFKKPKFHCKAACGVGNVRRARFSVCV
jgi:hypothetical protein